MGSRRIRVVDAMSTKRRKGWLQRYLLSYDQARCIHLPFVECYAIQAFSFASDFDPKLMPKMQNQITMRKVCIFIKSLWLLLGLQETQHASHPETEVKRCLRRNQRWAARAAWVRCEPSTSRRDPRTSELARSSRIRAQPFLLNYCRSEYNRSSQPCPLWSPSREAAMRSVQVTRWARTRSGSRRSILEPNYSG